MGAGEEQVDLVVHCGASLRLPRNAARASFQAPWTDLLVVRDAEPVVVSVQRQAFIRGDSNFDGVVDVSDPIDVLVALFFVGGGERHFRCPNSADANDDNQTDISDAIYSLAFLFVGGPPMPQPFPEPGFDRNTEDPEHTGCLGF